MDMTAMMGMMGGGGGGGSMIMSMFLPMLKNPETIEMLNGKVKDMYVHLAGKFKCEPDEVSLNLQFKPGQKVMTKDAAGNEVPVMVDGKEKIMDRFLVLFFVLKEGKMVPVEKAWGDEWLSDVIGQMSEVSDAAPSA